MLRRGFLNYTYYFTGSFSQIWQYTEQIIAGRFVIYGLCAKLLIKPRLNKSQKAFEKRSSATNMGHQENRGAHVLCVAHGTDKSPSASEYKPRATTQHSAGSVRSRCGHESVPSALRRLLSLQEVRMQMAFDCVSIDQALHKKQLAFLQLRISKCVNFTAFTT